MTIVRTSSGDLQGYVQDGIHYFKRVPFAAPPVGELRFVAPQPPVPWDGTLDCTVDGPICPQNVLPLEGPLAQVMTANQPMDEDCLTLTVTTPAVDGSRPVMVWIHGGAFTGGSGSTPMYDGTSFARDGVVYVSINYRLHALGFLYLDELFEGASSTGNLGILDQVRALEWVRDNIAAFGGDPSNVTIFGESAGGMSVGTLMGTSSARGLFRRAVAQSGAGSHNLKAEVATRVARRALELLDVAPGDWAALRAAPAQRFVEVSTQLSQEGAALLGGDRNLTMVLLPVVDGVTRDRTAVEAVAGGDAAPVDLLIGTCAEECRLFVWAMPEAVRAIIPIPPPAQWFGATGRSNDDIRKVYSQAHPSLDELEIDVAVWTDAMFTVPAARLADAQRAHQENVWSYRLSWRSPAADGQLGACHALDIPFVFDRMDLAAFLGDQPPVDLSNEIHGAWVRFATTGDPNGGGLPPWPRHHPDTRPTMDFDTPIRMIENPDAAVSNLWEGLDSPGLT
jgi:para-nitrobenzyl esterase